MATAAIGALVRFCGHQGTIIADIYEIGNTNVIHASTPGCVVLVRNCLPQPQPGCMVESHLKH